MSNARSVIAPTVKLTVFTIVTTLLTALLGLTIENTTFEPQSDYTARFSDVLALNVGDDVRMSGVRVGKVTSVEVTNPQYAEVGFTVDAERRLAKDVTATLKIRNLIGQRYVALESDVPAPGQELPPGSVIPLRRTSPALNLTELFNGFKPLFQTLDPADVNQLAGEIVQVFQGEGGTINNLLAHTASLTSTIADRDKVIGQVIDNLNRVLDTVNHNSRELTVVIDQTQRLVSGLAAQRDQIGESITGMAELADTTAGLVKKGRAPLRDSIAGLLAVSRNLNDSDHLVERFVRMLPRKAKAVTRTVSYGSWANFYLCELTGTVGIASLGVEVPITPIKGTDAAARCRP